MAFTTFDFLMCIKSSTECQFGRLELLDKNQLYVNLSEIEDEDFGVSAEDKALNRAFYGDAS